MLLTYKTLLTKKSQLNSNTYLYHFNLLEPKEIIFKAGQYLILKVPSDRGPVSRLYSIASPNTNKNNFDLIIGIIPGGLASNYLFSLEENTEVVFEGAAGVFLLKKNEKIKTFLVTGTGIAPARSILISNIKDQILKTQIKNQKFYLFWGLKKFEDIYLLEELKQLSNETLEQFKFKICLSREQNLNMIPELEKKYFDLGHVDTCFEKQLKDYGLRIMDYEFYICGGRNVVEALKQTLLDKNIPFENIIIERF